MHIYVDLSTDPKNDALIEVIGEKCLISAKLLATVFGYFFIPDL